MSYCDERGRASTHVVGVVQRGHAREVVAVRNLSVSGAMIEMVSPPEEGDRVCLECGAAGPMDARVVWVAGNRCGLLFDRAIPPELNEAVA